MLKMTEKWRGVENLFEEEEPRSWTTEEWMDWDWLKPLIQNLMDILPFQEEFEKPEYSCWERDKCMQAALKVRWAITHGYRNVRENGNPEELLKELKFRVFELQKKWNHCCLEKMISLIQERMWG